MIKALLKENMDSMIVAGIYKNQLNGGGKFQKDGTNLTKKEQPEF